MRCIKKNILLLLFLTVSWALSPCIPLRPQYAGLATFAWNRSVQIFWTTKPQLVDRMKTTWASSKVRRAWGKLVFGKFYLTVLYYWETSRGAHKLCWHWTLNMNCTAKSLSSPILQTLTPYDGPSDDNFDLTYRKQCFSLFVICKGRYLLQVVNHQKQS